MREPRRRLVVAICAPALLLATAMALGDNKLQIQTPAAYDIDAKADPVLKAECAVDEKLSQFVRDSSAEAFDVVTDADGNGARQLTLTILNLQGKSGGVFTGSKAITLHGTLRANGEIIGSFHARRSSVGGGMFGYFNTCKILERCARELGKDIAHWLRRPSLDAWLGEMEDD